MLEKIKSLSLKWKFAAVVFLALLGVLLILMIALRGFLNREFDALYGDPATKGFFIADLLIHDLRPVIQEDIDSQELQHIVDSYKAIYGIYGLRYIFLLDAANNVIVDSYKNKIPASLVNLNHLPDESSESRTMFTSKARTYHDCAVEIQLEDRGRGTLRIGVEQQQAESPVWQTLKTSHIRGVFTPIMWMAVLLTVLVTALLSVAFWWFIVQRLESITQATERMSFGDLENEVEVHSLDEFGLLEETLNQMRGNSKDAIERLKRRKY